MNLTIMGSVNSYTKTMKLQTQWQIKQKNGDYNSHKKTLEEWVNTTRQALKKGQLGIDDDEEKSQQKMRSIMNKLYNGKKLTDEERRYLRIKNPQAYVKMCFTEQEQKAYERRLRRCRTKEEVQRLKMTCLASSLSTVNAVANNPHISTEKKLEVCMQEKIRCDKLQASTRAFVRSGAYHRLPSEVDLAKNKHKKPIIQTKPLPKPPEKPEEPDIEKPAEPKPPEIPGQPETEQPSQPDISSKPENPSPNPKPNRPASTPGNTKPEQPKIYQSKRQAAHAAYTAIYHAAQPSGLSALNIQA